MSQTAEDIRNEMNDREHHAIMDAIKDLKKTMVSKAEFTPVKAITYTLVGTMGVYVLRELLVSVVAAANSWDAIIAML